MPRELDDLGRGVFYATLFAFPVMLWLLQRYAARFSMRTLAALAVVSLGAAVLYVDRQPSEEYSHWWTVLPSPALGNAEASRGARLRCQRPRCSIVSRITVGGA